MGRGSEEIPLPLTRSVSQSLLSPDAQDHWTLVVDARQLGRRLSCRLLCQPKALPPLPMGAIPSQLWGLRLIPFTLTSCKMISITSPTHVVMFKVIKYVLSLLSLEALLSSFLLGTNENEKKKKKVCGSGTSISTFYLWANSSQSLFLQKHHSPLKQEL